MTENQPEVPAVDERSGDDVVEGVETAAAGSRHDGVQRPPEEATPGTSPVEQTYDDPAMTEGRVGDGSGGQAADPVEVPAPPVPEVPVSGGAQNIEGARISDRVSAADDEPSPRVRSSITE